MRVTDFKYVSEDDVQDTAANNGRRVAVAIVGQKLSFLDTHKYSPRRFVGPIFGLSLNFRECASFDFFSPRSVHGTRSAL